MGFQSGVNSLGRGEVLGGMSQRRQGIHKARIERVRRSVVGGHAGTLEKRMHASHRRQCFGVACGGGIKGVAHQTYRQPHPPPAGIDYHSAYAAQLLAHQSRTLSGTEPRSEAFVQGPVAQATVEAG